MKKIFAFFITITVITIFTFSSCKNVIRDEDYYYTETEIVDDMLITLMGKGYGLYGQMIEKYKSGSIKELMQGQPMRIRTSSADDNNSTYNEIYLTFEKNGYIKTFDTDVSALKKEGLTQVRVYYTDDEDKEYTLSASKYLNGSISVEKSVKSLCLCIKAYKYYPSTYSQLVYKDDITEDDFKELSGKQVNNEISINYINIEY